MASLTIEYGEYAVADARAYIEEHTTTDSQTQMLSRLFTRWQQQRTEYGIGYLPAFLTWLGALGFAMTGYYGEAPPWSGHTINSADTLLNDDFGWTYFYVSDHGPFVAIEWDNGLGLRTTPDFYRDDRPETFFDWSRGVIWCTNPTDRHTFATEDSVHWSELSPDGTVSQTRFRLHELKRHLDADGDTTTEPACPRCGNPILAGETW